MLNESVGVTGVCVMLCDSLVSHPMVSPHLSHMKTADRLRQTQILLAEENKLSTPVTDCPQLSRATKPNNMSENIDPISINSITVNMPSKCKHICLNSDKTRQRC